MYKYQSYIEAPRWADCADFLKKLPYHCSGIEVSIDDTDKGWIRETVYFTIRGTQKEDVQRAKNIILRHVDEYNQD